MLYTRKKFSNAYYLKGNFYEVMAATDYTWDALTIDIGSLFFIMLVETKFNM